MSNTSDLFYDHYEQGDKLYRAGDLAGAVAEWREASCLNPDNASVHYNVGWGLAHQGEQAAAVAELQEALRLQPGHASALHVLGVAKWQLGERHQALETLREAVLADPDNFMVYSSLAECQRRALHWRGLTRTVIAVMSLPDSEERSRVYARCDRIWNRLMLSIGLVTGFTVVFFWLRRRRG